MLCICVCTELVGLLVRLEKLCLEQEQGNPFIYYDAFTNRPDTHIRADTIVEHFAVPVCYVVRL